MQKDITVHPNDIYQKVGGTVSKWVVEKVFEYSDMPAHVRLIEQGGNERTVTVALSALADAKEWRHIGFATEE